MIFPGHLRKAIQAKFVNIGPLIMIIIIKIIIIMIIIIIIIIIIMIIMIMIMIIVIIIITHLNKSRLTSDFKFQLLKSALSDSTFSCLAGILPTDI